MRRAPSLACLTAVGLALLAGIGGCEVLVGDSLPADIHCADDLASECPSGEYCSASHLCIPCLTPGCGPLVIDGGRDAGGGMDARVTPVDAGHDTGVVPPVDAPVEAPATPGQIGDVCGTAGAACASGLSCLDTSNLTGLGAGAGTICSEPCCTSADCGGDNVCYPTTGGNLCISAALATKCTGGASACGATCCTSSDCTSGAMDYCAIGESAGGSFTPSCTTFGGDTSCDFGPCQGVSGDPCAMDSDCESGVCSCTDFDNCACAEALDCCGPSDCASAGGTCGWLEATDANNATLVFRGCTTAGGQTASGMACHSYTECQGTICESFTGGGDKLCSQPCCQDSDCSAVTGWVCLPYSVPLTAGSVALLVCQPAPTSVN